MDWIMKPITGFNEIAVTDPGDCTGGATLKQCTCTGGMLVCDCVGCLKVQ
jgi:hypothetical protein